MLNDWCKRCGNCCKGNIVISGLEALWMVGRKIENVGIGCPFLKNNECSIYDCRPVVCRQYGPKRNGDTSIVIGQTPLVNFGTCQHYKGDVLEHDPLYSRMCREMIEQSGMVELSTTRKPGDVSVGRFRITADANGNAQLSADPDYVGDVVLSASLNAGIRS